MGASFGRGSIAVDCHDCGDMPSLDEALSVAAHLGFMITPRLGLLGEHWSVRYSARGGAWFDDSVERLVAQHISVAAAQLFVTDSLWIKGGLGIGWHITDGDYAKKPSRRALSMANARISPSQNSPSSERDSMDDTSSTSFATFAAAGWEFAQNSVFATEIQFRVGATRRSDDRYQVYNTAMNVGCSWY
jgi:hypothetical protein